MLVSQKRLGEPSGIKTRLPVSIVLSFDKDDLSAIAFFSPAEVVSREATALMRQRARLSEK